MRFLFKYNIIILMIFNNLSASILSIKPVPISGKCPKEILGKTFVLKKHPKCHKKAISVDNIFEISAGLRKFSKHPDGKSTIYNSYGEYLIVNKNSSYFTEMSSRSHYKGHSQIYKGKLMILDLIDKKKLCTVTYLYSEDNKQKKLLNSVIKS